MVFAAFLLLTVSTLVTHGKGLSTGVDVLEYCKSFGVSTYCGNNDMKPRGYPQPAIDRLVKEGKQQHLLKMGDHLIDMPDLEDWSIEGNCAVNIIKDFRPHTLKKGNRKYYIVQSEFFNQTIPWVECRGDNKREALDRKRDDDRYNECFEDFIPPGSDFNTECVQRTVTTSLYIYIDGKIRKELGEINADCMCART